MPYTALAQEEAEPFAAALDRLTSASPTLSHPPASPSPPATDRPSGTVLVEKPPARYADRDLGVAKLLSSLTGSQQSYDLVEDDDYEDDRPTPMLKARDMAAPTEVASSITEDVPVRTASISRQLPMNHPKPDLQSLQGAYVKNVERLEESAERLSMTSSLEGELQKMKWEQRQRERTVSGSSHADSFRAQPRQFSSTSLANSIAGVNAAARSGGYSPAGYFVSPVGSIRSPNTHYNATFERRASQVKHSPPETDLAMSHKPVSRSVSNATNADRPDTAASQDTYRQTETLFTDFDGVHYNGERPGSLRQASVGRPPRVRDSRAVSGPLPREETVYYPAPVPVMLNLPMRLSRMNWAEREKKRLQVISSLPEEARKSAVWLANEPETSDLARQSMANIPSQLRASAFFESPMAQPNLQLKNGSAVATLDSILDAAAYAPVSAFTDHPIAGQLGREVYGVEASKSSEQQERRKSTLGTLLRRRSSGNLSVEMDRQSRMMSGVRSMTGQLDHENPDDEELARSVVFTADDGETTEGEESKSEHVERPGFSAAPTTLLAELQMRKAQQKQRNRTAADAFPNGMHSTLLELDTVTQLQQKARKQKHIKLAWEDQDHADKKNFDDEDIPLGLFVSEKNAQSQVNLNRPLGLMESRELEENEPLSSRRARLRGEPLNPPSTAQSAVPPSQVGQVRTEPAVTSMAGVEDGELGPRAEENAASASQTPDIEETLGQRRKRLKEEALRSGGRQVSGESSKPASRPSRSLADVLQQNPIGYQHSAEAKTAVAAMESYQQLLLRNSMAGIGQQDPNMTGRYNTMQMPLANMTQTSLPGYFGYPYQSNGQSYAGVGIPSPVMSYRMPMNAAYGVGLPGQLNMMNPAAVAYPYGTVPMYEHSAATAIGLGPPLDAKQRATIDRWRQGIA